jgi:hypothetical protein
MRKNIALMVLAFVAILASCSPVRDTQLTLQSVPVGKTWKVLTAVYGTEEPSSLVYADFRIKFTDTGYEITDRADSKFVFLGKDFPKSGVWVATTTPSQGFNFNVAQSKGIFVKETSKFLSTSTLNLEYFAEIPGKVGTNYKFTLIAVQ